MAAVFCNQTTLFYNQTNILSGFVRRERSDWARKGDGASSQWSYTELNGPQSKVRVLKILSQPRDIREIVFCFDDIISVL